MALLAGLRSIRRPLVRSARFAVQGPLELLDPSPRPCTQPESYRDFSADASVKMTSRPLSDSGQVPGQIRLGAALHAGR